VPRERLAHEPAVIVERGPVPLGPELAQEAGRSLDVAEQ